MLRSGLMGLSRVEGGNEMKLMIERRGMKNIKHEDALKDGIYRRLFRNFKLQMICNIALIGIIIYATIDSGLFGWVFVPLLCLGVSSIATGVTCNCLGKRSMQI
jgi:hypothetical protein